MRTLWSELGRSVVGIAVLAIFLCGLYPAATWAVAQALFPRRAEGSLIERHGRVIGSALLGQSFSGPEYFHPRPSASDYRGLHSGGSNLGPTSRALQDLVAKRIEEYRKENGLGSTARVPTDAVTASASGLDPDISLADALDQAPRVARARGLSEALVVRQVEKCTTPRLFGLLGQPRVNVLLLNLALDEKIKP